MTGMTPRRLQLWADPSRLAGFDGETALEHATVCLRQQRDDVELTQIKQLSPDSIGVVLLVAPTVRREDEDDIAAALREILEIGPGHDVWIPDERGEVRGISGQGRSCPECGGSDGSHLPGCPRSRQRAISGQGHRCPECGGFDRSHVTGCPRSGR